MREKLVRDKMHEVATTPFNYRIADPSEMTEFLGKKLIEEARELWCEMDKLDNPSPPNMNGNKKFLTEEAADLLEALGAILQRYGIDAADVLQVKISKAALKGRFDKGIIWDGKT